MEKDELNNYVIINKSSGEILKFSTSATWEDVNWTIKTTKNRPDLIRKHDSHYIKRDIDFITYHLRRYGFKIENEHIPGKIINLIKFY